MKVCVYTICKNEIKYLDRWIESVKEADYICILDTGSTDGTWERIQEYPEIISKQVMFGTPETENQKFNFGLAKSLAFQLCPSDSDICVTIDIDEYFSKGWRDLLVKNFNGRPVRCTYLTGLNQSLLSTKYIAHPYNNTVIWKYPVFEEPAYWNGTFYSSYWSYLSEEYLGVGEIIVYHTQDTEKDRDYEDLMREKINLNYKVLKNEKTSYEETLQILYSTIEPFNFLKNEYLFYLKEFLRILFKKRDERILSQGGDVNTINYDEERYFLLLAQEYNKLLGNFDGAVKFSEVIREKSNKMVNRDRDVPLQILSLDAIPVFIANENIKEAYRLFMDNILFNTDIKTNADLVRLNVTTSRCKYIEDVCKAPRKLIPNLEKKVIESIDQLRITGSFTPFKLK